MIVEPAKLFDIPKETAVQNDMMIAILSDMFVGTRISTMATTIGMSRVVQGKDPNTNFVFIQEGANELPKTNSASNDVDVIASTKGAYEGPKNVTWRICESCMFVCNPDISAMCGNEYISS